MKINFTKMQGSGNDFIVINAIEHKLDNPSQFALKWCNRHFGIGADQLLLLEKSDIADFRMRIFNSDGSEVEMCGNGIRCFAKFVADKKLSDKVELNVETLAGIISPKLVENGVKVNMGNPKLKPAEIPVIYDDNNPIIDEPFQFADRVYHITTVSMGNPHCVIFVDKLDSLDITKVGPMIEHAAIFPNRTNVELVEVVDDKNIKVKVWERGAGLTLACGTGACASVVAASLNGLAGKEVCVSLPGGELYIQWAEDGNIYMTGPGETVFEGIIEI